MLIKFGPFVDANTNTLPFINLAAEKNFDNMLLQDGDIIIADTAEDETVGKATEIINTGNRKIVSGLHTIACRPKIKMIPTYLGFYFNSEAYHKQLYSLMQGIKVLSISKSNIETTIIKYPCIGEQAKICSMLYLIEKRIAKQQQLIEHLKKYKRGVSKKVFDEIHNDTNCMVKQFSEVFELLQNNTFSRELLTEERTDVFNVHYGDILVKYDSVVDPDIDAVPFVKTETDISKFNSSSYLQDGDVIFADTAEDYTVGKMCEIINVSNRKILSGLHTMPFRPTIVFAPMYLGYYLNSAAFRTQILPMIQGAKVSSISKSEMKKTVMYIPSVDRQREIVNILNALDKRIKRTEIVLDRLKEMKKGLLQNLFI